jgi:hypothetical protein
VFRRWLVFLFPIESATEWEITEDQYFDGQIPSVRPSGKMLMTDFVPYTNGINPSVKLFNGVVYDQIWKSHILYFFLRFGRLLIYIYIWTNTTTMDEGSLKNLQFIKVSSLNYFSKVLLKKKNTICPFLIAYCVT